MVSSMVGCCRQASVVPKDCLGHSKSQNLRLLDLNLIVSCSFISFTTHLTQDQLVSPSPSESIEQNLLQKLGSSTSASSVLFMFQEAFCDIFNDAAAAPFGTTLQSSDVAGNPEVLVSSCLYWPVSIEMGPLHSSWFLQDTPSYSESLTPNSRNVPCQPPTTVLSLS